MFLNSKGSTEEAFRISSETFLTYKEKEVHFQMTQTLDAKEYC